MKFDSNQHIEIRQSIGVVGFWLITVSLLVYTAITSYSEIWSRKEIFAVILFNISVILILSYSIFRASRPLLLIGVTGIRHPAYGEVLWEEIKNPEVGVTFKWIGFWFYNVSLAFPIQSKSYLVNYRNSIINRISGFVKNDQKVNIDLTFSQYGSGVMKDLVAYYYLKHLGLLAKDPFYKDMENLEARDVLNKLVVKNRSIRMSLRVLFVALLVLIVLLKINGYFGS